MERNAKVLVEFHALSGRDLSLSVTCTGVALRRKL